MEENGEEDVDLVVAHDVLLKTWRHCRLNYLKNVFLLPRYTGDPADPATTADMLLARRA